MGTADELGKLAELKDKGILTEQEFSLKKKQLLNSAAAPNSILMGIDRTAPNGKSKLAAALLAFFLGSFGIHKFYLGRLFQGILYLLFCWTFIPSLLGFIEAIVYATMSDEKFNGKYGAC